MPKMNRNPFETHQNLIEDPFQSSIDNFYKRINVFKQRRSGYAGASDFPAFPGESGFQFPGNFDLEYLKPAPGFDVIHRHKDFSGNAKFTGSGKFSGFADGGYDAGRFDEHVANLPDNFHDADASTKISPDGKIVKSKYEIHKTKGKNYNGVSYSTSNSVTW